MDILIFGCASVVAFIVVGAFLLFFILRKRKSAFVIKVLPEDGQREILWKVANWAEYQNYMTSDSSESPTYNFFTDSAIHTITYWLRDVQVTRTMFEFKLKKQRA